MEEKADNVWILRDALKFSLRKRFEALIHLLYQFKILQEKYRKHYDNACRNVIFDDNNCRFFIIDFGESKKLFNLNDKDNFKFVILLMRAIFCDPGLFEQISELEKYDFSLALKFFRRKPVSTVASREEVFKLCSPIENAITRLFWALNPSSVSHGNCTFKRAIDYCHDIYKKGELLTKEDVVEIANNRLYDSNITNDDIRNGKLRPLIPTSVDLS